MTVPPIYSLTPDSRKGAGKPPLRDWREGSGERSEGAWEHLRRHPRDGRTALNRGARLPSLKPLQRESCRRTRQECRWEGRESRSRAGTGCRTRSRKKGLVLCIRRD